MDDLAAKVQETKLEGVAEEEETGEEQAKPEQSRSRKLAADPNHDPELHGEEADSDDSEEEEEKDAPVRSTKTCRLSASESHFKLGAGDLQIDMDLVKAAQEREAAKKAARAEKRKARREEKAAAKAERKKAAAAAKAKKAAAAKKKPGAK